MVDRRGFEPLTSAVQEPTNPLHQAALDTTEPLIYRDPLISIQLRTTRLLKRPRSSTVNGT